MCALADINFKICDNCQLSKPITNYMLKGYHINKENLKISYRSSICRKCIREYKRKNNICMMCHRKTDSINNHCEKHLKLLRDSYKRKNKKDKETAFKHYGNKCKYCNDNRQLFLTIDHINDNGAEHRRQQRSGNNQGHNIYAWLRKNKYPEGFQILCYNCNCAKQHIGEEALLKYLKNNNI